VLVLDNARIHNGGNNKAMAYWLWMWFDVFVAWLPMCLPELNQIELIWNYLIWKLSTCPHKNMRATGCSMDAAAYVAKEI
jgi:transposase